MINKMENKCIADYEFLGIFNQSKFYDWDLDTQKNMLIKLGIYTVHFSNTNYVFSEKYRKELIFDNNLYTVQNNNLGAYEMYYRGYKYVISQNVLDEIFEYMEDDVTNDDFTIKNIDEPQMKISNHLSNLLTNIEKFNFSVNKYNEYYFKIENIFEIIYFEETEMSGISWKEFIISEIRNNILLIKTHLFTNYYETDFVPIFNNWRALYHSTEMMKFFKIKMLECESNKAITKNIDLSFQVSLLEAIITLKDWDSISATKKGAILSNLLGKSDDNIKKIYLEFNKPSSKISEKYLQDREKANILIKNLRGNA